MSHKKLAWARRRLPLPIMATCDEPPSSFHVERLPNELLEFVFEYLPFENFVHSIPLVNRRWHEVQVSVCQKKTRLLIKGDQHQTDIPQALTKICRKYIGMALNSDTVTWSLSRFDSKRFCSLIKRSFPKIESLIMVQFRLTYDFDILFDLLVGFPNLVCFKLIVHDTANTVMWWRFCEHINRLCKLRHLTLFSRLPVDDFTADQLRVLPQLESLTLGQFDVNLSELRSIRRLSLNYMKSTWLNELRQMELSVARQITQLTINTEQLDLPYIDLVANKFTSLQYLHIRSRLPLRQLLPPLVKLTKLKHFRLWHYQERLGPMSTISELDLLHMPQLESVQYLHLYIRLLSPCQLSWISALMPSLEYIKFDRFHRDCWQCDEGVKPFCEMNILAALKQCPKLKRIYLDRQSLQQQEDNSLESFTQYDQLSPNQL